MFRAVSAALQSLRGPDRQPGARAARYGPLSLRLYYSPCGLGAHVGARPSRRRRTEPGRRRLENAGTDARVEGCQLGVRIPG
jgi:hypothetical protein